jgi:signal peptide peptidase SppA
MTENTSPNGRYPHVQRLIFETPWAIEPLVLQAIREMIVLRADGGGFTPEEIQARIGPGPARRDRQNAGSVSVLPLHGVITPKADLMTEMSGGTSVDRFRADLLSAVDDKDVSAIVLDVSSPGGMTDMIPELAADIREARGRKPIVAVANTKAASAAYWLASQADEIIVTPSGSVGSVGVFAAHDDLSGAMEKAGVKTTLVSAGKDKTLGNPYEPLSEDARAMIQEHVDEMYQMFTADVAKGRRVPVADVRGGFGEGRMLTAKNAVKAGMADSVATLQATVDRFVSADTVSGHSTAAFAGSADGTNELWLPPAADPLSFTDQAGLLHDSAVALVERLASLAELRVEGRLTKAKRQSLTACSGALSESVAAINGYLADTDPDKQRNAADAIFLADLERRHLAAN